MLTKALVRCAQKIQSVSLQKARPVCWGSSTQKLEIHGKALETFQQRNMIVESFTHGG